MSALLRTGGGAGGGAGFWRQCLRLLNTSPLHNMKSWRVARGLPVNRNAEGPLTDAPDYTFLDGRPTPLLTRQRWRMLKQRDFAEKIVQLSGEIDFAIGREEKLKKAEQDVRDNYVRNKLKPKGNSLLKK